MFAILSFKRKLNTFVFYTGVNSITALKLSAVVPRIRLSSSSLLSYFFVKKYLLVGASSMLWIVDKSVSQSVRDVCISHQSDWINYKQSIKFLVEKVNGMCEDMILIQFGTTKNFSFYKRGRSIHILGLYRHFLWVRLRILVMDGMSLEVWNSTWASRMQMTRDTFIFSYKGNLILLFFRRSKFN